jgi:hypothetical protein
MSILKLLTCLLRNDSSEPACATINGDKCKTKRLRYMLPRRLKRKHRNPSLISLKSEPKDNLHAQPRLRKYERTTHILHISIPSKSRPKRGRKQGLHRKCKSRCRPKSDDMGISYTTNFLTYEVKYRGGGVAGKSLDGDDGRMRREEKVHRYMRAGTYVFMDRQRTTE